MSVKSIVNVDEQLLEGVKRFLKNMAEDYSMESPGTREWQCHIINSLLGKNTVMPEQLNFGKLDEIAPAVAMRIKRRYGKEPDAMSAFNHDLFSEMKEMPQNHFRTTMLGMPDANALSATEVIHHASRTGRRRAKEPRIKPPREQPVEDFVNAAMEKLETMKNLESILTIIEHTVSSGLDSRIKDDEVPKGQTREDFLAQIKMGVLPNLKMISRSRMLHTESAPDDVVNDKAVTDQRREAVRNLIRIATSNITELASSESDSGLRIKFLQKAAASDVLRALKIYPPLRAVQFP